MSEAIELLPCPFCGDQPSLSEWRYSKNVTENGNVCPEVWFLGCNCFFVHTFAHHGTKQDAIEKWNTRPTPPHSGSAPDIVSKLREALEFYAADGSYKRGMGNPKVYGNKSWSAPIVQRDAGDTAKEALALLPTLESLLTQEPVSPSLMDIGEHNPNSEWMPPTLDTIARWKQHQVISRRDWVNVLTLLDKHMAMLARSNTALEMFWRMARTGASYKNCIRAYNDAGLGMLLAKEPVSLASMRAAIESTIDWNSGDIYGDIAKAVLDAAGVPYTEAMLAGGEKGE